MFQLLKHTSVNRLNSLFIRFNRFSQSAGKDRLKRINTYRFIRYPVPRCAEVAQ